ncbi:NAD(P)-binding protein [Metaclostridioides mangenotii]|uniref:NADPH-dependent glutamate synthase beta subunit-like oxidoreductase n=1 Tax=Metaclostridioides mangenotii TaxID=1540 RepID=A0ABS4EAC7_9FIRM|nr:NAD(P)-binding protein [Clostridioides mangenotii]MBP1854895.1 NADPH-dependent glutamate synthase beta subunit-like oxidoreductase [Clostridioides mangenotii]
MSRLSMITRSKAQMVVEELYRDLERRIVASPPGLCPVDMSSSFLKMCHAQTCGKCVPCRIGLGQLGNLLEDVLNGDATLETIDLIERTARVIANSADCAIGYEAAEMVLKGLDGFRNDYEEHILRGRCLCHLEQPVPCVALCPADVDIPGYIALVGAERYADAVKLIRKDNPFPTACALVCEHPCEARCRRNMIDDSVNIRGLKRMAIDYAGYVPNPENAESTGKKIAVIGGGPSGLSAAYYLQLMGHQTTVFEKRKLLGGMLTYGIPSYRLPRKSLEEDIKSILDTGVEVKIEASIGSSDDEISMNQLREEYDAVYISIGAHTDKKIGIENEDANGVISAVEMLRNIGDSEMPDFKDKTVVVIGGGNVAMDVTRSAIRLGAKKVNVVYRRRKVDMTALMDEVEGAIAEGADVLELHSPEYIETDENNNVKALWVSPKMVGLIGKDGRPRPSDSNLDKVRIPCDTVIVAIGQGIETPHFEDAGIPIKKGGIDAAAWSAVENTDGVFAGGDCVTGPATVIRAIAAGKVAAANIDTYLGFDHIISTDVEIPTARLDDRPACGRVNMMERDADDRIKDFDMVELSMSREEAKQEANRCLRCDYFGYGVFKGGRVSQW